MEMRQASSVQLFIGNGLLKQLMKVSVNLILIRWGVLGDALRAAQTYIEGWEEGAIY